MIKKLFTHSTIYGLAPQVSLVAGIFALPIITRYLTSADFGIWGTITAYIGGLEALATLGLRVTLTNSFFKMPHQHKWLWRQTYGFLMLWSIPYALLVAGLLFLIVPNEVGTNKLTIILLATIPLIFFGPTALLGMLHYQLRQKPLPIVLRTVTFGLLTIFLNVYTIAYLKMGYMGWAWANFIVVCLMNLSYWYTINISHGLKPIFNFKWYRIKKSLAISIPTIPHFYSNYILRSSDRIVMDRLHVPVNSIGEYNIADRFGGYFSAIVTAANRAIGPMLMENYKKGKEVNARNLVFVLQIVVLAMTLGFSLWSKEVFAFLIKNDDLKLSYPLSIILVMAYNYRPMYIAAANKIQYKEKTLQLLNISLIAGIINVALNFILIPIVGFKIAAYTTFLSLMYMGFSGHFIKKIKSNHSIDYYAKYWLLGILLSTAAVYIAVELPFNIKIFITLSILMLGGISIFQLNKKII